MTPRVIFAAACALFAAGVGAAQPEVSNGWIRLLPPGAPSGGYFELRNTTKVPAHLVGASSPGFREVMLHRSVDKDGRSTMIHLEKIEVAPGGRLSFKPGGYHLMLLHPTAELKVGASVPVTLEFADGNKVTIRFQVRGATGD